jgi:hypothetical protein
MLTAQETQQIAEIKQALRALEGITPGHAYELECSLDILLRAVSQTPEERATWTHTTFIIDKEIFENAGYDVSELTKADLDELADSMKDYWIGGKEWDRAIEYAARGVLELKTDEEENNCECCNVKDSFVPDQDGACAKCRHEHTQHYGRMSSRTRDSMNSMRDDMRGMRGEDESAE